MVQGNAALRSAHLQRTSNMLQLRPNCECCNKDLPPDADAVICSFECTFCPECAHDILGGVCPNCCGNFSPRPIRPAHWLEKFPPSSERVVKAEGCVPQSS